MISVFIIIFGHFFLATLQILTIVIRFIFILALRTRLEQRIFLIFICYDSKSNCSIIVSHLTTWKGSNTSSFEWRWRKLTSQLNTKITSNFPLFLFFFTLCQLVTTHFEQADNRYFKGDICQDTNLHDFWGYCQFFKYCQIGNQRLYLQSFILKYFD